MVETQLKGVRSVIEGPLITSLNPKTEGRIEGRIEQRNCEYPHLCHACVTTIRYIRMHDDGMCCVAAWGPQEMKQHHISSIRLELWQSTTTRGIMH